MFIRTTWPKSNGRYQAGATPASTESQVPAWNSGRTFGKKKSCCYSRQGSAFPFASPALIKEMPQLF